MQQDEAVWEHNTPEPGRELHLTVVPPGTPNSKKISYGPAAGLTVTSEYLVTATPWTEMSGSAPALVENSQDATPWTEMEA